MRQHVKIFDEFFAQHFCDQLARDVVRRRPQPASGDDQVRATQRFAHGGLNLAARIRDRDLPRHNVSHICEPTAQPLLMRIEHTTQHQLATCIDDFNIHKIENQTN